jgi:serine/threonine protein kinase
VLQEGMEIGGYRLVQQIGAGAFGVVWEAVGPGGAPVALKFLDCRGRHKDLIAGEVRVLRALSELSHPNIVRLLSVHASSRHLVLVMEKADCNLADLHDAYRQEEGRDVPPRVLLDLLGQAAEALDFMASLRLPGLAGGRGLQHCDVKPTNLLVQGDRLKVADFGLCAAAGWQAQGAGGWRGTFPYAAPELFRGRPAAGTDQYALAMTFCETVMGGRPFWPHAREGDPPQGQPIDLTKVREREVGVLARALHPQPWMRYPSCAAFVDALRRAASAPRPEAKGSRPGFGPAGSHAAAVS